MLTTLKRIPAGIWVLGFVSMLMDLSSEMIHSLLPLYLVTTMGVGAVAVGFIEGIAEATALIVRIFSGTLSDYLGKRKMLVCIGYGLGAFTKPVFALASSVGWVVAARFTDRVGKGIRAAPRDALLADLAPADLRGACYGLRQSLDTIGGFMGPLAAIGLMLLSFDNFRLVFLVAAIPAFLSFFLITFGVKEPDTVKKNGNGKMLFSFKDTKNLPPAFWAVVAVGAVMTLARFSEAFLILRAQDLGLAIAFAPGVLIVMNVVYSLSAFPMGWIADKMNRYSLLVLGLVPLIAGDLLLGFADNLWVAGAGVVLWGLHMGMTQGILAALVADTTPAAWRGTAFGAFNFVSGIAMLVASVLAGVLWEVLGPGATFGAGAVFAALTIVLIKAKTVLKI